MADLSSTFIQRWRSMHHVGAAKPGQFAMIRSGYLVRRYGEIEMLDGEPLDGRDLATLPGGRKPWHADWEPKSDWLMLPNLTEVSLEKTFDGNGVPQATIQLQNVVYQAIVGVVGTYNLLQRGKLSPLRGFTNIMRVPASWSEVNEWYELLRRSAQIVIFQGYGNAYAKTFTGLIDKVDMTSNPDHMTITSRNFAGPMLTEQRVFGRTKDPTIRPPVTFADRDSADETIEVSGGAKASSSDQQAAHPPRNVTLKGNSYWRSRGRADRESTEWVQIRLKKGRYQDIYLRPLYAGMEVWVSVYVKDLQEQKVVMGNRPGAKPQIKGRVDNEAVRDGWYDPVSGGSWWDLSDAARAARIASGEGVVPGGTDHHGGIPYVKHFKSMDAKGHKIRLGHKFEVGSNSIVRVHFRHLHWVGTRQWWYAGVERLLAYKRKVKKQAKKNKWILVDDASDVVKVVLMWAGFKEWEVESFGSRIDKKKPWVFHQADFLIDLINYVKQQGDYNFFMGDPSPHDLSLGVPIFRRSRVTSPTPADMLEVKDTDLLTGINVSIDHASKPSIIRARGREAKKGERGTRLEEDRTRRVSAYYVPPWHRRPDFWDMDPAHAFRDANIMRHANHYDNNLGTTLECKVACILIALQYSLQANTAEVEIPGYPGIDLDSLMSVVDEGTGVNTRIWTAHIRSTFTSGQSNKWTTQVGGSMLDIPDTLTMAVDYIVELNKAQASKQKSLTNPHPKHLGGGS